MELSMSMFAKPADYWKARAEAAEDELAKLRELCNSAFGSEGMATDLTHLGALAKWLSDDNELPSSGDAACVCDAIEEIERLRKDEARLDWLADPNNSIGNVQLPTEAVLQNVHSLRDAIDAAMRMEQ